MFTSALPLCTDSYDVDLEEVATPPSLILMPVSILDFVALVTTAHNAARSIHRFVQLHDPTGVDIRVMEQLNKALAPFYPTQQPDSNSADCSASATVKQ